MEQDDLISVGTIGLIKAINTFNVGNLMFLKLLHAKALSYLGFIIQHVPFDCKHKLFFAGLAVTSFRPRRLVIFGSGGNKGVDALKRTIELDYDSADIIIEIPYATTQANAPSSTNPYENYPVLTRAS